jgi:hypothetical protein
MKRIVRLTENDLARIVRRVINEQNELCNNGKNESEAMKQAVYKIKDKATYDAILKQVQTSPEFKKRQGNNYSTIMDWLSNEGLSTSMSDSGPVPAVYNALVGVSIGEELARHLIQFSGKEGSQTFRVRT